MNIRGQIGRAWQLTQDYPKFKWFAFLPALLTTLVGIGWLFYQYSTLAPLFFNQQVDYGAMANQIMQVFAENQMVSLIVLAIALVVVFLYLFLPVLFQGGLIALLEQAAGGEPAESKKTGYAYGFSKGMLAYLPLFEFHTLLSPLSVISIFSVSALLFRGLGWEGMRYLWPLLIFLLIFSFVVGFFLAYTDFFIVLQKRKVFEALGKSVFLVILHLPETALMMILMLLIGLRIIINIVLILLIPLLVLILGIYFSLHFGSVGFWIAVGLAVALVFLVTYLNSLINVFSTAVWLLTFQDLYAESSKDLGGDDDDAEDK